MVKFRGKKVSMAFMMAVAMVASSASGGAVLAADDYDTTVVVTADSQNGDQEETFGNITSDNDDAIQIIAEDGKSATVTTGNLTGADDGAQLEVWDDGSSATLTVNGDIKSNDDGFWTDTEDSSSVSVTVNGDINARGYGVSIDATDDSTQKITVNGNITSEYYDGVNIDVEDDSKTEIKINGTIDAYAKGVYSESYGSSVLHVSTGGITTEGSSEDFAVLAYSYDDSSVIYDINGDIQSSWCGPCVEAIDDSSMVLNINGSVVGDDWGIASYTYNNGTVTYNINGDVSSDDTDGGTVYIYDYDSGASDIFIDGTVSGGGKASVCADAYNDNTKLTVWRIIPANSGVVATNGNYDEDETFEKRIMYIIKLEQPEGGKIEATDEDGNKLTQSHDYDVAYEGNKVLLNVKPDKGYKLTGAYSTVDGQKLDLLVDDNGNYYVMVERGGGVYISAELEKEKYDITFYNEDGSVFSTQNVEFGSTITIPAPPEREGYKFLYWEGSKYYPGDEYQVTEPHSFKAVWEKEDDPDEPDDPEKPDEPDKPVNPDKKDNPTEEKAPTAAVNASIAKTSASPATGDDMNVILMIALIMVSGAGAASVYGLKKRQNR